MKSILALFLFTFPIVANASSILKYKPNSAYCTGNFTGLNLIKYECSDEESGCTFGSYLSLYAQFNVTTDFPTQAKLTVSPSLPHVPGSGWFSSYDYSGKVKDNCGSTLSIPAGNDAGYSCPEAGLYNVHSTFKLFGASSAWYASAHGYNIGVGVRMYDLTDNSEFGFCYAEIRVKEGTYSPATDWAIVGGAGVLASMAGYLYRKRRVAAAAAAAEGGYAEDGRTTSHFELVSDPVSTV